MKKNVNLRLTFGRIGNRICLTAVAISFLICMTAFAANDLKVDQVVAGLQKRYENVNTYKLKFHQTLTSPVFKKVIREAYGTIYFQKPGKIRWEYDKPDKRLYLIDSEFFWDYDPKAAQVLKIPIGDALAGDVPHGFLFGAGNLKKQFKINLIGKVTVDGGEAYRISLESLDRDLQAAISNLALVVRGADFAVVGSSFVDPQGNENVYGFSDIIVNPALSADLFMFQVPKGVKVILPITESEMKKKNP